MHECPTGRVADPDGFYPDKNFKDKPDPKLTFQENNGIHLYKKTGTNPQKTFKI